MNHQEPIDTQHSLPPTNETSESRTRQRSLLREILETVVIAILIFVIVRSLVLNFKVDGESMLPTFEGGERTLVSRVSYGELNLGDFVDWIPGVPDQNWLTIIDYGSPERGDVIVFTPPEPGSQKPYIKRVIGISGDHVEIRDDGRVYVNGIAISEPYIDEPTMCRNSHPYCDVVVPPGHVFAIGDNRDGSEDSRFFGVIPEERIIGKAWIIYWPLEHLGTVDHPDYPELEPGAQD